MIWLFFHRLFKCCFLKWHWYARCQDAIRYLFGPAINSKHPWLISSSSSRVKACICIMNRFSPVLSINSYSAMWNHLNLREKKHHDILCCVKWHALYLWQWIPAWPCNIAHPQGRHYSYTLIYLLWACECLLGAVSSLWYFSNQRDFGQIRSDFILILVSCWAVDSLFFSNVAFICRTVSFHDYVHFGKADPLRSWRSKKEEQGVMRRRWWWTQQMLLETFSEMQTQTEPWRRRLNRAVRYWQQ